MTEPQGAPTPHVQWQTPTMERGPAPGIEYAPHGARLVAYIIDGIILGLVLSLLVGVGIASVASGLSIDSATGRVTSASMSGGEALIFGVTLLLAFFIGTFYFPFFWARGGQTPGMRPFGLVVVRDRDGSRIGWGTALLRLVGLWIAIGVMYIGLIWVFIDGRRRGWQDLIAGTVVIKRS